MSEPFTLVTYGSDEGVGSLLAQSEGENLIPVTFYQHALTEAQAGGGDQVPSAGHHVGGWVIFSPKNTVCTWY